MVQRELRISPAEADGTAPFGSERGTERRAREASSGAVGRRWRGNRRSGSGWRERRRWRRAGRRRAMAGVGAGCGLWVLWLHVDAARAWASCYPAFCIACYPPKLDPPRTEELLCLVAAACFSERVLPSAGISSLRSVAHPRYIQSNGAGHLQNAHTGRLALCV
ncbi:hypothetical protein CALVIDRAFT_136403 [Calocera viscosa TUFC12733]|uniref:Uncharacterized protein n=1 Tax=Calocera viscosa (strain TUFC12733) TaxID=1330018 RepID=A0A167LYF9_CALVF|nr:hypothetical protein CALVIDRAFT_136403 [Calocera viscosa TUFC12733]